MGFLRTVFFYFNTKLATPNSLCRPKKLPPAAMNQKDPGFIWALFLVAEGL
jgi:hypothetical protein